MPNTSTLRPGLLVSLKTSVRGNVSYIRKDIVAEHVTDDGKKESKWETERTVIDPAEHEMARQAVTAATLPIRKVCSWSAFGLLCPENKADELDAAIAESHRVVDAFNANANLTRVSVYIMCGRIAPDDVEAMKAINSEIADLLTQMEVGVKNLDVKSIREAANKARTIGTMLTDDASERVAIAIEAARKAARAINKAGEQAAQEVDLSAIRRITDARTSFLDLDDAAEIAAPKASVRAVDLDVA